MEGKILLVDDEKRIADILKYNLSKAGFTVDCAHDGNKALEMVDEFLPDLIILDVMLPYRDGLEVCREVRKKHDMPIIMLTARESEMDKVIGLEMGADDYITKPFSTRELMARIKANLRRYSKVQQQREKNVINLGHLSVDPNVLTVTKKEKTIPLTPREFELIHYLAQHINHVMTREHLLETVWGYDYYGDVRVVDVTVRRLREKIEDNPSQPSWIQTRRGVGYYMVEENPS